jgi:hypothetical protein
LAATAQRYGTGDTLVAVAELSGDASAGKQRLLLHATRYGGDPQPYDATYPLNAGDSLESVLSRAASALSDSIQDRWKSNNRIAYGSSSVTAVTVPVTGLDDWLAIRKRLRGIALIQQVEVVLLSRNEARLNLHYLGDLDQLVLALGQADLSLTPSEGERILRLAGNARRP